jgi:benzoyl-CoA reductase/2-hydroxyglutaryl-CoA dehydratase subunit BcrC/BadD/HgdB
MVAKAIKEELGIPAITLEYGGYDCRDYPAGALRTRVETFAELLRMRKASKEG